MNTKPRKKIVAGNWKMNLTVGQSVELIKNLAQQDMDLKNIVSTKNMDVIVAPTYLSLDAVSKTLKSLNATIKVAAQNVHHEKDGAFTGEISVNMIKDLEIEYCIVGHSERRILFQENNSAINKKIHALLEREISPIFCIGETLKERKSDKWNSVISEQLKQGLADLSPSQIEKVIIAYEPVWAIGTGVSASSEQAQEVHQFIRGELDKIMDIPQSGNRLTVLYGGSVNLANAKELFSQPDIDGGLVGGASLKPHDFIGIIKAV